MKTLKEMKMKTSMQTRGARTALVALAAALLAGSPAAADEIRLLSAAAMQAPFKDLVGKFERQSGHRLLITYTTMGAITERVLGGETADVVIGSTPSIARLAEEKRIDADSRVTIAKVGIGLVVPIGSPKPPIRSVADLKRALLAANTVVYARPSGGGAAGIHVAAVIEKLGLTEALKAKTIYGTGGDITEVAFGQGYGALGLTQISEIVGKLTAEFVGPLPDELQTYTGITVGIPAGTEPSQAVTDFIAFLKSPVAVAAIRAKGMETE